MNFVYTVLTKSCEFFRMEKKTMFKSVYFAQIILVLLTIRPVLHNLFAPCTDLTFPISTKYL